MPVLSRIRLSAEVFAVFTISICRADDGGQTPEDDE
jgi:hypothetical protein